DPHPVPWWPCAHLERSPRHRVVHRGRRRRVGRRRRRLGPVRRQRRADRRARRPAGHPGLRGRPRPPRPDRAGSPEPRSECRADQAGRPGRAGRLRPRHGAAGRPGLRLGRDPVARTARVHPRRGRPGGRRPPRLPCPDRAALRDRVLRVPGPLPRRRRRPGVRRHRPRRAGRSPCRALRTLPAAPALPARGRDPGGTDPGRSAGDRHGPRARRSAHQSSRGLRHHRLALPGRRLGRAAGPSRRGVVLGLPPGRRRPAARLRWGRRGPVRRRGDRLQDGGDACAVRRRRRFRPSVPRGRAGGSARGAVHPPSAPGRVPLHRRPCRGRGGRGLPAGSRGRRRACHPASAAPAGARGDGQCRGPACAWRPRGHRKRAAQVRRAVGRSGLAVRTAARRRPRDADERLRLHEPCGRRAGLRLRHPGDDLRALGGRARCRLAPHRERADHRACGVRRPHPRRVAGLATRRRWRDRGRCAREPRCLGRRWRARGADAGHPVRGGVERPTCGGSPASRPAARRGPAAVCHDRGPWAGRVRRGGSADM
ncbi:MAG: Exoenzymes regulatory protein AepA in lipid-linked oligosaccharide synthesis cluster, partial [uncultured Nocardioidaceae bacterium]